MFERFVSEEWREPPDIDVDFEHERREIVMQCVFDTYGREHKAYLNRRGSRGLRRSTQHIGYLQNVTA